MARELSDTSLAVWRFVHASVEKRGYPPTLRELARGCFLSVSAVYRHLARLEAAGVLEIDEFRARGIRLLQEPPPR